MAQTARCLLLGLLAANVGADYAVNESVSILNDPDVDLGLAIREDANVAMLNSMLESALPGINTEVKSKIPASIGACSMNSDRRRRRRRTQSAPQPCSGGDCQWLFYEHKSWAYTVFARWLGGLKSIQFTDAIASRPSSSKGLKLNVKGYFGSLPLSLYVGECATFDQCSKLWDNTHACCGTNKHFDISVSAICSSDLSKGPIDRLEVSGVDLDKIEVTEKIVGIKFNVKNLTDKVRDEIKKRLGSVLTDQEIVKVNGKKVTLKEFLNTPSTQQFMVAMAVCSSGSTANATSSSLLV